MSPDGGQLYYAKVAAGPTPVWRAPAAGGSETEILGVEYAATDFAATDRHLYFIPAADPAGKRLLMRMDLATGQVDQVAELRAGSSTPVCSCERWAGHGLTISPDGRTALIGQLDYINSDVFLVENFR